MDSMASRQDSWGRVAAAALLLTLLPVSLCATPLDAVLGHYEQQADLAFAKSLGLKVQLTRPLAQAEARKHSRVHARLETKPSSTGPDVLGSTFKYWGGNVINKPITLYYVWYGSFTKTAKNVLVDFAESLNGSDWWSVMRSYDAGPGTTPSMDIGYGSSIDMRYDLGNFLSSWDVASLVLGAVRDGKLPADSNAVYAVLTSKDVQESGFCRTWCAWHTQVSYKDIQLKVAFIGDPMEQCSYGCSIQSDASPNGDVGADAMVTKVAHEVAESVSNPDTESGWRDADGEENCDYCNWEFGATRTLPSGAQFNIKLGTRLYMLQQNWFYRPNLAGYCTMAPPRSTASNRNTARAPSGDASLPRSPAPRRTPAHSPTRRNPPSRRSPPYRRNPPRGRTPPNRRNPPYKRPPPPTHRAREKYPPPPRPRPPYPPYRHLH